MSGHTEGFGMHWPKWTTATRFLRRMAFGIIVVVSLLWFVARNENINSQRGIESSRGTGLSAFPAQYSYTSRLAKSVFPQAKVAQSPAMSEGIRIARTASLRVSAIDFSAARESVEKIVKGHDGFAASVTITSPNDSSRSFSAQFAIPTAQCDAALQEFRMLGRVEEERQGTEDVTAPSEDLDIRLKNEREAEIRLSNILRVSTGKVSDVLEVENGITQVREGIERMEAEQKRLNNRVIFASVELDLTEEYRTKPNIRISQLAMRMRNALIDGYHSAADEVLIFLEFFLSSSPSLLLWGFVLFWPVRWAWRRWQKSKAQSEAGA